MEKNLVVEISLRMKESRTVPECFEGMEENIRYRSDEKILYHVPITWNGFKNGQAWKMVKSGADVYFSLAYFVQEQNIYVSDFDGREVEHFDVMHEGISAKKYVKRKLCILKVLNEGAFELNAFLFDLDKVEPVIRILSVKCSNAEGLMCGLKALTLLSKETTAQ
jgi:hypothetical protein